MGNQILAAMVRSTPHWGDWHCPASDKLGFALFHRFARLGQLSDLDDAISVQRHAGALAVEILFDMERVRDHVEYRTHMTPLFNASTSIRSLVRLPSTVLAPRKHVSHREYHLLYTNALLGQNNNLQQARLPPPLCPSPLTWIPRLFCLHPTSLCIRLLLLIRIAFMATNSTENGLPSSPETITSVNHTRPQARLKAQFSGTSLSAYQDFKFTSSTTRRTPTSAIPSVSLWQRIGIGKNSSEPPAGCRNGWKCWAWKRSLVGISPQ